MKKLSVKKGSEGMSCLACVKACSKAYYKLMDPDRGKERSAKAVRLRTVRKMREDL